MIPFGKNYFYHEGKIYREVKPELKRKTPRWKLTDKNGKQHWISKENLEQIIAKKLAK